MTIESILERIALALEASLENNLDYTKWAKAQAKEVSEEGGTEEVKTVEKKVAPKVEKPVEAKKATKKSTITVAFLSKALAAKMQNLSSSQYDAVDASIEAVFEKYGLKNVADVPEDAREEFLKEIEDITAPEDETPDAPEITSEQFQKELKAFINPQDKSQEENRKKMYKDTNAKFEVAKAGELEPHQYSAYLKHLEALVEAQELEGEEQL